MELPFGSFKFHQFHEVDHVSAVLEQMDRRLGTARLRAERCRSVFSRGVVAIAAGSVLVFAVLPSLLDWRRLASFFCSLVVQGKKGRKARSDMYSEDGCSCKHIYNWCWKPAQHPDTVEKSPTCIILAD